MIGLWGAGQAVPEHLLTELCVFHSLWCEGMFYKYLPENCKRSAVLEPRGLSWAFGPQKAAGPVISLQAAVSSQASRSLEGCVARVQGQVGELTSFPPDVSAGNGTTPE